MKIKWRNLSDPYLKLLDVSYFSRMENHQGLNINRIVSLYTVGLYAERFSSSLRVFELSLR